MKAEDIEHIKVVDWFRYTYPDLKYDLHHFANERFFTPTKDGSHHQAGRKLKRMGVSKGVPDFFLAIPKNGYCGLWIELKAVKGRLTPEQADFIKRKNENGYLATAVWGFEAAQELIIAYLHEKTFS